MSVTIVTNNLESGDKIKITNENSKILYSGSNTMTAMDLAKVLEGILGRYIDVVDEDDAAFERF